MTTTTRDGTRPRSEVPEEDTWNLDDIYPSRDAWEADINQIRESLPELVSLKGTLDQGADRLLRVMQLEEQIGETLIKVYAFATLANDEDTSDPETQAMEDRARVLYVEVSGQTAFIEPEIIALPEGTVERYLEEEPQLAIYRHALESLLRQRDHVLDSETESLLASAGEVFGAPGTIFGMINDADMRYGEITDEDGKAVTLTKANFQRFMESRNRDVRREAFQAMHDAYRKQRNTIAATYA
ncbi:MAG: M3 family oligoendopeptidase, partial [Chloroflexota bacterium]